MNKVLDVVSRYNTLDEIGFHVVECESTREALDDAAAEFGRETRAASIGVKELIGSGSAETLSTHNESIIYDEDDMLRYFALGCLIPAVEGGATVIYDGQKAATDLLENHPRIARTVVHYVSTVYEGQESWHPLVFQSPEYGDVLRYRSQESTNLVGELPNGVSEGDFYRTVDGVLRDAVITEHEWQAGELVIVSNLKTLHSRTPYSGERRMLRYRYDDPHFKHIVLDKTDNE